MARALLCTDVPPDHGFLQFVYPAECARRGAPHPEAGDPAVARRTAGGNVCRKRQHSTGLIQPFPLCEVLLSQDYKWPLIVPMSLHTKS